MQNSVNRVNMLKLCAKDIAANADKLLADVPYYQDCDIVIGLHNDEAPFVKVVQRYVPEEIIGWYKENNQMLWILVVPCLIGAISAITLGGNGYKKTRKCSDLLIYCIGFGLLAFTLMFGAVLIFVL